MFLPHKPHNWHPNLRLPVCLSAMHKELLNTWTADVVAEDHSVIQVNKLYYKLSSLTPDMFIIIKNDILMKHVACWYLLHRWCSKREKRWDKWEQEMHGYITQRRRNDPRRIPKSTPFRINQAKSTTSGSSSKMFSISSHGVLPTTITSSSLPVDKLWRLVIYSYNPAVVRMERRNVHVRMIAFKRTSVQVTARTETSLALWFPHIIVRSWLHKFT